MFIKNSITIKCIIFCLIGINSTLFAQGEINDSTKSKDLFNRYNEMKKSDQELELEINKLLSDIEALTYEGINTQESIDIFHLSINSINDSILKSELNRISKRPDLESHISEYVITIDDLKLENIAIVINLFNDHLPKYNSNPKIQYILLRSLMNIYALKNQFPKCIQLTNEFKGNNYLQKDISAHILLSQCQSNINEFVAAKNTAENIFLKNPDHIDAFLQYMNTLVLAKEYAELEFYTDQLIVYNDIKSLIHLAIFQFSRGMTAEASSLVYFIEKNIAQELRVNYDLDLSNFKWNFNADNIIIKTDPGPLGKVQIIEPYELYELAIHLKIIDDEAACRFLKYAYMSTFSSKKRLLDASNFIFLNKTEKEKTLKKAQEDNALFELLQKEILKISC